MASTAQIKAIHTLKSKLHLDDENYRMNLSRYGVNSTTDKNFSSKMAGDFIKHLSKSVASIRFSAEAEKHSATGDVAKKKYYGTGERGYQHHLTPMQAERISILENLLQWNESEDRSQKSEDSNKRLLGFIFKQTGKQKAVQMLMNYEAGKVIVGMQRILAIGDQAKYNALNKMPNKQLKNLLTQSETKNT